MGVRGGGMLCRNMRTDSSQHVNLAFLCRGLGGLFLKMQRDFKSCVFIKFLGVLERICPAEFTEEKIKGVGGIPKEPSILPFFLPSVFPSVSTMPGTVQDTAIDQWEKKIRLLFSENIHSSGRRHNNTNTFLD